MRALAEFKAIDGQSVSQSVWLCYRRFGDIARILSILSISGMFLGSIKQKQNLLVQTSWKGVFYIHLYILFIHFEPHYSDLIYSAD